MCAIEKGRKTDLGRLQAARGAGRLTVPDAEAIRQALRCERPGCVCHRPRGQLHAAKTLEAALAPLKVREVAL